MKSSSRSYLKYLPMLLFLVLMGCASTKSDFRHAKEKDTVEAYEFFIQEHPDSELAEEARYRLEELIKERERKKQEREQELRIENERLKEVLSNYEVNVTTDEEFRADGWSVADARMGTLGLIGYQKRNSIKLYLIGHMSTAFLERLRSNDFYWNTYVKFGSVQESHFSYVYDDADLRTGVAVLPEPTTSSGPIHDAMVFDRGLIFREDMLVEVIEDDLRELYMKLVKESRR